MLDGQLRFTTFQTMRRSLLKLLWEGNAIPVSDGTAMYMITGKEARSHLLGVEVILSFKPKAET